VEPSSRTPEGQPNVCPVCGHEIVIQPSIPAGDAPCPYCGHLLWFPRLAREGAFPVFRKFTISDPSIRTNAQAIAAVFDRLAESERLNTEDRHGMLAALQLREELGSTGIGRGVAVPHAKYPGMARLIGAVADFPAGVDFRSLDGNLVHVVYLFVSPTGRPNEHLRVLEVISRQLRIGA
jgi:PTS system fructose-specific IIA component/PTS system nitrogen regulatory IIA component